jgi:hypothetical protein
MIDAAAHVSDHAVLRYLERAHGLDVEAVRAHLAGHTINAQRLGASAVVIGKVKLVIDAGVVVTTVMANWPTRVRP